MRIRRSRLSVPITVGEPISTDAVVERIRVRNGVAWVTFGATMTSAAGLVGTSKSTFIMSDGQPPADADEQAEPEPTHSGEQRCCFRPHGITREVCESSRPCAVRRS